MNTKSGKSVEPTDHLIQPLPDEETDIFEPPLGLSESERKSVDVLSETIAKLEQDLAREKDERNEERFYWLLGGFLLFNLLSWVVFEHIGVWSVFFILQVAVLWGLAGKFGHEWAVLSLGRFLRWLERLGSKKK